MPFIGPSNLTMVCAMYSIYLDDFFTTGSPGSTECSDNLQAMLSLCKCINAPIKTSKVEGPSTQPSFLGIVSNMTGGISQDRKQDILFSLQSLRTRNKCAKHQLLSLVKKLSFACKLVPARKVISSSSDRP